MNLDPRIAQALIEAVDTRVEQLLRARPYTAYGVVASVDVANARATVNISGDTSASAGFKWSRPWIPVVGELVRVVIDPGGDRYIDSIGLSGTVDKIGLGTLTAPTNAIAMRFGADVELYRAAANELRTATGDTLHGDLAARMLDKTSTQSITNTTYTAITTWSTTPILGEWVTYDGTDELVADRAGFYLAVARGAFDNNTTGIRIIGVDVNDVTNVQMGTLNQQRWPVSATDANSDYGFFVGALNLAANDRVCMKVWQNTGGALNLTSAQLGLFFLGY